MRQGAGTTVLCKPAFRFPQFYLSKAVLYTQSVVRVLYVARVLYSVRSPHFIPSPCFIPSPQSVVRSPQSVFYTDRANSLLQVRNALWVFQGERRRGTKSIRVSLRATETHMKPFVRTSFLGTRPSCLPSPGRPLFDTDDRKPIL